MLFRRSAGFKSAPRNYTPQSEPDKRTAERALREAGATRQQAKMLLSKGYAATAALNGWEPDLRDADYGNHSQPKPLRDAAGPGQQDIVENLMIRIRKLI